MTYQLNFRDRAMIGAGLYLGFLFVAIITLGWLMLIGGNPLTVENVGVVSATGYPNDRVRAGDIVGVRRQLCSDRSVALQYFPSLVDSRGFRFPLPGGMVEAASGCHNTTYGFVVPDLPAGEYVLSSAIRFQNNLVGRDESTTFPLLRIRIMR
uniref:Uncharacterized protein n=1 Tax=Pseudomonas phage Touem01 TaxID=3138548 RepID=A0AAU6W1N7_9VIRU